jgi:hypothetical protein
MTESKRLDGRRRIMFQVLAPPCVVRRSSLRTFFSHGKSVDAIARPLVSFGRPALLLRCGSQISSRASAAAIAMSPSPPFSINTLESNNMVLPVKRLIGANGHTPHVAAISNFPNAAGSGGAAVSVSLTFADQFGTPTLPVNYTVTVTPSQGCAVSVSNKTNSGFTVNLTPLSGNIAAGTFDCLVHA